MARLTTLIGCLLLAGSLHARVVHVPSPSSPDIQAGIDIAYNGDTVLVADGVYTGTGNHDIDLKKKSILLTSENGPDFTIIDCQGSSTDRRRGFKFWRGEDSTTIVDGFTVRNGYGLIDYEDEYNNWYSVGGAISIDASSPTIRNCVFTSNRADRYGGALFCSNSSASIMACRVLGNTSGLDGGGAYICDDSNMELVGSVFQADTAASQGGAVMVDASSVDFADCNVSQNVSSGGGGLFTWGASTIDMIGCSVTGNEASWEGAGIFAGTQFVANMSCTRCVISDNSAGDFGGGMTVTSGMVLTLTSCTISRNTGGAGGGIFFNGGDADLHLLKSCSITDNVGGGVSTISAPLIQIVGCTIARNQMDEGSAILFVIGDGRNMTIDSTVVAFNGGGAAISDASIPPQITCTDIFGNPGGDWTGSIADQFGVNGNISLDPMLCDTAADNYTISWASPCAPHNNSCGVLIGADTIGCGCVDSDGDGYGDPSAFDNLCPPDNCPYVSNPDQTDSDSDGIGDACECCQGRVGDANGSADDEPTIGDITVQVDALFISGDCQVIDCYAEADVNQSGGLYPGCGDVTIGDISALVDYLFITGPAPSGLPDCL